MAGCALFESSLVWEVYGGFALAGQREMIQIVMLGVSQPPGEGARNGAVVTD